MLKGENCLIALINYYKHDGQIYHDSIQEINNHIRKHQKTGKISINLDQQKLHHTLQEFC